MRLPQIQGVIRRRILLNFRVDPDVMQRHLPPRFRPRLHEGAAMAGVCLIRLAEMRPKHFPAFTGIGSENAAHRIAVTWEDDEGRAQEGVYIPRRDTDSMLNHLAGGRIFPGEHHQARFEVDCSEDEIDFEMKSVDGQVTVQVAAVVAKELPPTSRFRSLQEASDFFERGSVGYSVTADARRLDGVRLVTRSWAIEPLNVRTVYSSYFSSEENFPGGSVHFDCGLLMRNIAHEWHGAPDLYLKES